MHNQIKAVVLAAAAATPLSGFAFGESDYLAWFKANQTAEPQFVDGDVITYDKADLVRPFIPQEFQDEWIFEGMEMSIKDANHDGNFQPAQRYLDATAKHAGQATIASDGAIENYAWSPV